MKRYGLLAIICISLICAAIYIDHVTNYNQPLVISEVCPHNRTILYDRFGGYSDYIEIHNQSDNSISVGDYYLSDNKNNMKMYRLPDVVIEPDGYEIFWCRQIDSIIEPYVKERDNICGFSLKDGDPIYLLNPEAMVIDKVKLPAAIPADMSYTRLSDNKWTITKPSALMEYVDIGDPVVISAEPVFTEPSGFYDKEFTLGITCSDESDSCYDIYYTLDSSNPSPTNGIKYTGPFSVNNNSDEPNKYSSIADISVNSWTLAGIPIDPVDKAVVIRAVCVDAEGNSGPIRTATYFVGYNGNESYDNMMVASLVTDPDNLFGYENGIYVTGKVWDDCKDDAEKIGYNPYRPFANYYMSGAGWKRPAYIEIFDEDRNICGSSDVKIGIMGQYSTTHVQKSISLAALNEDEILKGNAPGLLDGIIGTGATSLALRAGGNKDIYATKVRDTFAQECVKNRNIGVQNAVPVQLFLDGEYWGLYHLQERIDAGYVVSHYGVDSDNIVVLKMENVKAGEEQDLKLYEDVIEYAQRNDLSVQKNYDHICELIDIQSFIDYNCLNIYVANTDSITNNYAYWRAKEVSSKPYCDGRWRWLIYDTDDSSGVVEDEMSEPDTDSFVSGHWLDNPLDEPLLKNLMENSTFKDQFARTFLDMADNDFAWENVEPLLENIEDRYCNAITLSMRRNFDSKYTVDDYKRAMDVLKRFYRERGDYIVEYMFNDLELNREEYGR